MLYVNNIGIVKIPDTHKISVFDRKTSSGYVYSYVLKNRYAIFIHQIQFFSTS